MRKLLDPMPLVKAMQKNYKDKHGSSASVAELARFAGVPRRDMAGFMVPGAGITAKRAVKVADSTGVDLYEIYPNFTQ